MKSLAGESWVCSAQTRAVFDALAPGGEDVLRFVGGCVRNALMEKPVGDIDMATTLEPGEVIRRLEAAGLKAVPTGIDHGTITAVSSGVPYEITTLRRDVATDGRRAVVAYTKDWREDAARRDFTMNALYADGAGKVHDPLGGFGDLEARRVRFIGDAKTRIEEDYLRILRFFRIHAWYGKGPLDEAGLAACQQGLGGLASLSAERVRDEILKLLASADPLRVMDEMAGSGVLGAVMPQGLELERFRSFCALDLSEGFEADALLRLGALLAGGVGEAETLAHYLRLSNAQANRLKALKNSSGEIDALSPGQQMRHCLYTSGLQAFEGQLRIAWSEDKDQASFVQWRALLDSARLWSIPTFALSGRDVMALGVAAGPDVGRLLKQVEGWWIEGDFTSDTRALKERLAGIIQAERGGN